MALFPYVTNSCWLVARGNFGQGCPRGETTPRRPSPPPPARPRPVQRSTRPDAPSPRTPGHRRDGGRGGGGQRAPGDRSRPSHPSDACRTMRPPSWQSPSDSWPALEYAQQTTPSIFRGKGCHCSAKPSGSPDGEQGHLGGRIREEKRPQRCRLLGLRGPPADPLFASWPWPRHHWMLVGSSCYDRIRAAS